MTDPSSGDSTAPISVIIPAFNRRDMIERAVRSAANQLPRRPAEIIVVDDCSDDDTAQVAEALGAKVVRHAVNRGAASARNTGLAAATQPWVAPLDSDDEWLPWHLETLLKAAAGPEDVLIAGAAWHVGVPEGETAYWGSGGAEPRLLRTPADAFSPFNLIPSGGLLLRHDALLRAGGWREDLLNAEDWDLCLRILEEGSGIQIPEVVVLYHYHAGQKSRDVERLHSAGQEIARWASGRSWCAPGDLRRRQGIVAWERARRAAASRQMTTAVKEIVPLLISVDRMRGVLSGRRAHRLMSRSTAAVRADDPAYVHIAA